MSLQIVTRRHPLLLPLLAFAQFLLALDYNIVLVALPDMGEDLGMSETALQWVVSSYALAFGGLLLLGGRLGDVFGRRRLILLGLALFAVGSLAAALAVNPALLLSGRVLQGIGGALLSPAVLATIAVSFEEGPARFRALAIWASAGAVGLALGSALGGILMAFFTWRATFLLLVPLAIMGLAGAWRAVPHEDFDAERRSVDLLGGIFAALGVAGIVFALAELPTRGADATVLGAAVAGVVLLTAFLVRQRTVSNPLLQLSLFRSRTLTGGLVAMVLFTGSIGTSYYIFTLFTQSVLGTSAMVTGLAFLPWGITALLASTLAKVALNRLGIRGALILGLLIAAAGTAGFASSLTSDASLVVVVAWTALLGIGQAVSFAPLFASAGAGVPAGQQGVASALMSTIQQIGTALGLAVLIGLATWTINTSGAVGVEATANGLQIATWVGAGILASSAALTALIMPGRK
ncbi:MFS transporter [Arthrobacter zhaoguopingii]|uniref:MFS transporter n=1 Tax=Arthrobacter zhaoguopingii TaxID=2681491 RepID=UPI00135C6542|nr:MFS transporter [Arthrobacter zhaoguopingii]